MEVNNMFSIENTSKDARHEEMISPETGAFPAVDSSQDQLLALAQDFCGESKKLRCQRMD